MRNTQETGNHGEELAKIFLLEQGYLILEENWRYKKAEIDIISVKDNQLVIVEVKTRASVHFGSPEEFVSQDQQDHLFVAANAYMEEKNIEKELRFDIIAIVIPNPQNTKIKHIEDAFYPGEF